eukprot:g8319.t1
MSEDIHSSDFAESDDNDIVEISNPGTNDTCKKLPIRNERPEPDNQEIPISRIKRQKHEGLKSESNCVAFSAEIWLKIFSCLSAMDLSILSCVSTWFHQLADDAALWRDLYLKRWSEGNEGNDDTFQCTWKMIYFRRDRDEAEYLFRTHTPEINDLLKEVTNAKRLSCLDGPWSIDVFKKRPMPSIEFLSKNVKSWLTDHGFDIGKISEIPWWSKDHGPFVDIDDVCICEKCGCVHICHVNCLHQLLCARESVCPISGVTYPAFIDTRGSDQEQEDRDNEDTNYLGKAFIEGYYSTAEDDKKRMRSYWKGK